MFPSVVFGAGLTLLATPLTSTVLAAGLLSVAALPALVGLTGEGSLAPEVFSAGYTEAMWWCVALLLLGALVAAIFVPGRHTRTAKQITSSE